ncbi:MAG: hypothetical protein U1F43_03130 [Myxococcota bacterium]
MRSVIRTAPSHRHVRGCLTTLALALAACGDGAADSDTAPDLDSTVAVDTSSDDSATPADTALAPDSLASGDATATATATDTAPTEDTRVPMPDVLFCHTPCRADLIEDGVVRRCSADHLIDGCVGDLACRSGSCVGPDEAPKACSVDSQCPSFQRCGNGICFSDCERDDDCTGGDVCHLRVCRPPCERVTGQRDSCADGTFCDSPSGTAGVCMPLAPGDAQATRSLVPASFALDTDALQLDAAHLSQGFTIVTDSPVAETFTIVRRSHRAFGGDGTLVAEAGGSADLGDHAALDFVTLAVDGAPGDDDPVTVTVPPDCDAAGTCPLVTVVAPATLPDPSWLIWEGMLEVRSETLGVRYVSVAQHGRLDGRWAGEIHYFSTFPDKKLHDWAAGTASERLHTDTVGNGLVRRWGAFRRGALTGGVAELYALLTSTETESWRFDSVMQACPAGATGGACYPYVDTSLSAASLGVRSFVSNLVEAPIPTGHSELPFSVVLREGLAQDGHTPMEGRVESPIALHWPGNPAASLTFEDDPKGACNPAIHDTCVHVLRSFDVSTSVAARYVSADGSCAEGFEAFPLPWLATGFGTNLVGGDRVECRPGDGAFQNPVPDGRARTRHLKLLDGVMIGADTIVMLFEEEMESFIAEHGESFSAYGYMVLHRDDVILAGSDYLPDPPASPAELAAPTPESLLACDPAMQARLIGTTEAVLTQGEAEDLVTSALDGVPGTIPIDIANVHYYCEDTGLFDGGAGDTSDGSAGEVRVACPPESNVRYFAFRSGSRKQADVAAMDCQKDYDRASGARGSCGAALQEMVDARIPDLVVDAAWRCADLDYCSGDRLDLRAGKEFFVPDATSMQPLAASVDEAFRYRTRFVGREGKPIGFAPVACDASGSDATPYCYDTAVLSELRQRIDCLYAVVPVLRGKTSLAALRLADFASAALGVRDTAPAGNPQLLDGFERLYAELLVMLGDEAFTSALRSRFDEAGVNVGTFRGSQFEVNGIDLTGIAGHEMASLYEAAQLYETAVERLYRLAPMLVDAVVAGDVGSAPHLVTSSTVTGYLDRLVRASSQRARAYSNIAQRYLGFHRPDLARAVIGRAYATTYLESAMLGRFMLAVQARTSVAARDQVVRSLEDATRRYRVALQEMREVHDSITDAPTFFGYPADYVPFPVRDDADTRASNAFEDVLRTTLETVDAARRVEDIALESSRSFDTDQASFEEELVRIAANYEDRLGPICGYFVGDDGRTYVATPRHATESPRTAALGDPCGAVGNGEIDEQVRQIELLLGERQQLQARQQSVEADIREEAERVDQRCQLIDGLASFQYKIGTKTAKLNDEIRSCELAMGVLDRFATSYATALGFVKCSTPADCIAGAAATIGWQAFSVPHQIAAGVLQGQIDDRRGQIDQLQLESARWETEAQCDALQIDSAPVVAGKLRDLYQIDLEANQLALRIEIADAELRRLRLEASRTQEEQVEAEQLAINVEAARNDPNVRILKNDAVLNADAAFQLAIRQAYRTTLVYEYYTSTSYARRDQLFLVRMVGRGDYNLDQYLAELRDAFFGFEEEFRAPAARVERISVRDDIFAIPLTDVDGRALDQQARNRLFRERLQDPRLLDEAGRLRIPFATDRDELAPCTKNHKINFIEVALFGGDLGDDEADVLWWQDGTGTIDTLRDGIAYYRLPPAVLVAQPYFNRATVFDPSVYRRYEFRERPFLNSSWAIVLDQRGDKDNQDIQLGQLDDIALYVYYTDFTDAQSCR